jgi:hypothetical protein
MMINHPADVQENLIKPLLKQLEDSINHLALAWRSCESLEEEKWIEVRYRDILRCMIQLGFNQALDMDAELPHELMPQEYFDLFE